MKLRKLLEKTLYLQEVTIYDVDNDDEYYKNVAVSELLDFERHNFLGRMKVKEIYTEHNDVIYIGVQKEGD